MSYDKQRFQNKAFTDHTKSVIKMFFYKTARCSTKLFSFCVQDFFSLCEIALFFYTVLYDCFYFLYDCFFCEVALFFYTVRLFFAFFAIEMFCFSVRNFLVCNCLIFCQIALYSTYKIVQFFCLIVCFRGLNFSYLSVHKCFLTSTGHTYILLLDVHLFSLGLFCFHLRFFCFLCEILSRVHLFVFL